MKDLISAIWVVSFAPALGGVVGLAVAQPPLSPPPQPAGNPTTESKRLLGKILFWDEQLSSSNSVACGTCHAPSAGGADPRTGRNPGGDGLFSTADDVLGSPAQFATDATNSFSSSPPFLLASQVTQRASQSVYTAAYSAMNFWDGRAGPAFDDPETGATVLTSGGALEAQSIAPLLSPVEMGHLVRPPAHLRERLSSVRPLALADRLPPDLAAGLQDEPDYPELFRRAFGTAEVSLARAAMAISVYERTLVPDQTPWDRFAAGDAEALTPLQAQGLAVFNGTQARCVACHGGNLFTDDAFHNTGVRPVVEDPGREGITGLNADRGRFRTPTLRNAALRPVFFHNGGASTLPQVIDFYRRAPGALPLFTDNLDPLMQGISITDADAAALGAFIAGALTDPRVAAAAFPFDTPRLWSQRADLAATPLGGGVAPPSPQGAPVPLLFAPDPAMIGAPFRVGLGNAPAGWSASLRISESPPVGEVVVGGELLPALAVSGEGVATARPVMDPATRLAGVPLYAQWELAPQAGGTVAARSTVASIVPFCARQGCAAPCPADMGRQGGLIGRDGLLNNSDFVAFIDLFFSESPAADVGRQGGLVGQDGLLNNNDFVAFIDAYFSGC